jgi:hypothetical protein
MRRGGFAVPARRFLPKFCFILVAALLVFPFVGCGGGSSGSSGGGGGEIVPDLWVDIDNDTDATIGNEGVGSKQDPYDGINYALGFATAGDAIGVADGTYLENVAMVDGVDLLGGYDSSFDVRDPDLNTTVIDGGELGDVVTGANDATIDGFVITNSGSAGVFLDGVNTTVTNNVITFNEVGVELDGSNATISNNAIGFANYGIVASNTGASEMTFPVITNNRLYYNSPAMYLSADSSYPIAPTISNNVVTNNARAIVGFAGDYGDLLVPTISNNEISYSLYAGGISLYVYEEGQIHADVIANDISQNAIGGVAGMVDSGEDYPTYTNFPSLSLVAHGNDIHDNMSGETYGGGISLVSQGYYPSYSRTEASISNNMIRDNQGGGIVELAFNDYYWWYSDFNPAASKINSVISNNIISSNDGPGIGAVAGFFEGGASGVTSVNSELLNNLIMYNGYGGVMVSAVEDYGVNSVSVHSVNDVIISNTGYGIGAYAYSDSDYGLSAAMVTIDNSIVRDNTEADLFSDSYPEGPEKTGFNTNFSNIGDGDSNGDGYSGDPGDFINGNISADPLFANFPDDLTLSAGSPSIDAGNPLPRYNDLDGTRNDQGLMGGALGGEPGPSEAAGIDPELGEPGPGGS